MVRASISEKFLGLRSAVVQAATSSTNRRHSLWVCKAKPNMTIYWESVISDLHCCKITNFRPVPIFVLST